MNGIVINIDPVIFHLGGFELRWLRPVLKKDGLLFLSYLPMYALGRFFLTFVRQEKVWFGGLQEAQVIAIVIMVISIAMFIALLRKLVPKQFYFKLWF